MRFNQLSSSEGDTVDDIVFDNEPHLSTTTFTNNNNTNIGNGDNDDDDVVMIDQRTFRTQKQKTDVHHHEDFVVQAKQLSEKKRYLFMAIIFAFTVIMFAFIVQTAENNDKNNVNTNNPLRYHSDHDLAKVRSDLMSQIDSQRIRSLSVEYSRLPHLAGGERNKYLAHKTAQLLREWGFDEVKEQVLPVTLANLTYRAVGVLDSSVKPAKLIYECKLDEVNSLGLKNEAWSKLLPASNGYSGTGRAEGQIVWANWGREEDFKKLDSLGIDLAGKIVVVRYGRIFRGNKAHLAEARGAGGVLIVNDPGIVGPGMKDSKDYKYPRKVFPNGPWANGTNVQRGSVYLGEGDPATPGFPSQNDPKAPRLSNEELFDNEKMEGKSLPKIPVQPLGWADAKNVLAAWTSSNVLPDDWRDTGFLDELVKGGIGPSQNKIVRMEVQRELATFDIINVMASLHGGVEADRTILLGAHRDSWGNAGAVDPISGSSINLEIARVLGTHHKKTGWRPRRTIQFNSFDAEEWSIIGSDEYVETNVELLRQRAIAYLNLDTAISGNQKLWADGSPLLQDLFEAAAKEIPRPSPTKFGEMIFEMMKTPEKGRSSSYSSPGAGTDHVGFYSLAGVPVLDSSFYNDDPDDSYEAVYHSYADTVFWIEKFVDPKFELHATMAKLYLNIVLRLSEPVFLPMRVNRYAKSVEGWIDDYEKQNPTLDWSFMKKAVHCFKECAVIHERRLLFAQHLLEKSAVSPFEVRALNDISFGVERVFLGADRKETGGQFWFKHVIYTPSPVNSYGSAVMPMIGVAVSKYQEDMSNEKKKREAEFAIGRIAQFIFRAGTFVNSSSVMPPSF